MKRSDQPEFQRLADERRKLKGLDGGQGKTERLTVTEVARSLLARQVRTATGEVKLSWNAKGDTQIEVSVPTSDELTIEAAADHAASVYDALRARYPRGDSGS